MKKVVSRMVIMFVICFGSGMVVHADNDLDAVYWDGTIEKIDESELVEENSEIELQSFEGSGILTEEIITGLPDDTFNSPTSRIIFSPDTRAIIKDTTQNPYKKVVLLSISFPNGEKGFGTGMMVGPNSILTAGHNIYQEDKGFASSIVAYPGYNRNVAPYKYALVTNAVTTSGWVNNSNSYYDFGVLKLNSSIGNQTGWFGLKNQLINPLTLTAYHGDHDNVQATQKGNVSSATTDQVRHTFDTAAGASGAGMYNSAQQIVAVHTGFMEDRSSNLAVRLNSDNLYMIQSWISDRNNLIDRTVTGVNYDTHVQSIGWTGSTANGAVSGTVGQAKRVEALRIRLAGYNGGVQYQAHVQTKGWMPWVKNGAMSGTEGEALQVEAFKISLTGTVSAGYSVEYRAHVQTKGWGKWVKDGAIAGTTGEKLRVEAIQIRIIKK